MTRLDAPTKFVIYSFRAIACVIALLQAWSYRHVVFQEDLISYLDMARSMLHGHLGALVNPDWSPLYPFTLGITLGLIRPQPLWECFVIKLLSVVLFLISLLAFEFLLTQSLKVRQRLLSRLAGSGFHPYRLPTALIVSTCYSVFLAYSLAVGHINQDTPDRLVTTGILICTALLIKVQLGETPISSAVLAGLTAGVGYLAKTFFFPLGLVFATLVALYAGAGRRIRLSVCCLSAFVAVGLPLFCAVSMKVGHPSFGEIGKLTFAECILYYPQRHGHSPELKHPDRILCQSPHVYEFATPVIDATYPVWFARSYWYEGLKLDMNWRKIWTRITRINLKIFWVNFLRIVVIAPLCLLVWMRRFPVKARAVLYHAPLLLPCLAGFPALIVASNMTHNGVDRYFYPFEILTLMALVFMVVAKNTRRERIVMQLSMIGCTIALLVMLGSSVFTTDVPHMMAPVPPADWMVAQALKNSGVRSGDCVAQLGFTEEPRIISFGDFETKRAGNHYYWAYLDEVRIVADIVEPWVFWRVTPQARQELIDKLSAYGVKAVVLMPGGRVIQSVAEAEGWHKVEGAGCYFYIIGEHRKVQPSHG